MSSTTTDKTINIPVRNLFAAYGLPEELDSDNGPQFTSDRFVEFLKLNGIKHSRSAPYHPATNGAAERFVQVLKKSLKNKPGSLTVEHHLANFLLAYRSRPHTTTGVNPAELFLKRQQRTRLSMVKPYPETAMHQKQQQQQQAHDHNTDKLRSFLPGDAVAVRLFRGQEKWAQGEVIQRLGPVSYMVRIGNKVSHVHIDHLVAAKETAPSNDAQLAATPSEKTLRSKSPDAEVRNPAHTLDLTPEVLPPVPEADASRTAEVPRHTCQGVEPAGERDGDDPSPGAGEVQPRTMLPCPYSEASRETGSLKALTVPVRQG